MAKRKIGNRWYTLHDTGLSKTAAQSKVRFLKKDTKWKYFRIIKETHGYSIYKGM